MPDFFSTPDDTGEIRQSELHADLGESTGAMARGALTSIDLYKGMRTDLAGGGEAGVPGAGGDVDVFGGQSQSMEDRQAQQNAFVATIPDTSMADAKARVKQEGLEGHLALPDQPSIKSPVLDLMIQDAHERRDREAAIARGPQGFFPDALGAITSLGVGMIDPLNIAAFSVPVLGEAHWGQLLAKAGDSIAARAGVRALQGGVQGAAGTALLQPTEWWLHTQDGQDYTMADALKSVVMGAGMGAAFHAGFGGIGDLRSRAHGAPLAGSPEDLLQRGLMTGTHVPGSALAEEGVPLEEVPGISAPAAPVHPAEAIADLPPAAQEDMVHSAIADVTADRPVRSAEMLQVAGDHDPRIAESIEAYHGSPYDFDRFDIGKIGAGEGAQSYGHGLYFAQNEAVAANYKEALAGAEVDGKPYNPDNPNHYAASLLKQFGTKDAAIEELNRRMTGDPGDSFLQTVAMRLSKPENLPKIEETGKLYKVRIKANQEHFIDWDKPVSEQPAHVREALRRVADDVVSRDPADTHDVMHAITADESANTFYERLADALKTMKKLPPDENGMYRFDMGHAAASRMLHEAGIPGIKYLDQGSRIGSDLTALEETKTYYEGLIAEKQGTASDAEMARYREIRADNEKRIQALKNPTHNFVVFNDEHIETTHKNGQPVRREELPQAKAPEPTPAAQRSDPATAAADPRWRELADAPPEHSTPEAIAESHAGDAVPEPASTTPKAATAIEQAATEAEEAWRKIEGSFTDAERAMVNDALDKLGLDRKAREDLINESAACLVAAEAA